MNMRQNLGAFSVCCCAVLTSASGFAHHGVNAQFDTSKTIEVTGTVTNVRFVNPHAYIYFDVINSVDGVDEWRCELRFGSLLRRTGWTTDLFVEGEEIKIVGSPARSENFACYTQSITFSNGKTFERNSVIGSDGDVVQPERELTLADGTPNIGGNWVAPAREGGGPPPGPRPIEGEAAPGQTAGQRPPGPPPGEGNRPEFELTQAGRTEAEGYVRDDMPRLHCMATNIFEDWTFDQMVNKIVQTDEDIIISFGFMDIVRTIHLDLDEHPADLTPSKAGHSIGKWEDGILIVDTVGFEAGYISAPPVSGGAVKNSNEFHVTERFSMREDGKTLTREYEGEDPLYLAEKFSGEDEVNFTDANYEPYACEDLTEEVR